MLEVLQCAREKDSHPLLVIPIQLLLTKLSLSNLVFLAKAFARIVSSLSPILFWSSRILTRLQFGSSSMSANTYQLAVPNALALKSRVSTDLSLLIDAMRFRRHAMSILLLLITIVLRACFCIVNVRESPHFLDHIDIKERSVRLACLSPKEFKITMLFASEKSQCSIDRDRINVFCFSPWKKPLTKIKLIYPIDNSPSI